MAPAPPVPPVQPVTRDAPLFQLYGENGQASAPDLIHCESIAERSRLHNWEIRPHRHHGLFQLLWLEEGSASCQLDESGAELDGGMVLLVPQHSVHGFRFSQDARGLVVTVSYALLGSLSPGLGEALSGLDAPDTIRLLQSREQVEGALRELQAAYDSHGPYHQALIHAQLTAALAWLLRERSAAGQEDKAERILTGEAWGAQRSRISRTARQHVARFSALVEADFLQHATLTHYAKALGISAAHLNALCRQETGHSALSLVHARQMREARRLLVYTSMTVREVSDQLGFSDPAYFTRFFKRNTSLSPRDFRQRAGSWHAGGAGVPAPAPQLRSRGGSG